MIIHLPPGTTSVVLRFDGSGHNGDVTLMPSLVMLPPPASSPPAKPEPRRMVILACAALGTMAVMAGVTAWKSQTREEAVLNLPHVARWSGNTPQVPAALQAELDRVPTVIPPSAAPSAVAQSGTTPAAEPPAGANPFGLE